MSEHVCKACGSTDIDLFYKVDRIPVHSCLMVDSHAEALAFPKGDLELGFCNACGFIQNVKFDPKLPQNAMRRVAEFVDANYFNCGPPGQCKQERRKK